MRSIVTYQEKTKLSANLICPIYMTTENHVADLAKAFEKSIFYTQAFENSKLQEANEKQKRSEQ